MSFNINHMSPVLFGENASAETGKRLKMLGCTNVLCIFDKGVKDAGITAPIIEIIKAEGIGVSVYDGVKADPPDFTIEEAAEIGRKANVDGVVGIGGGSTMDTAKAVNILLSNPSPITNYLPGPGMTFPKPSKPIVLLPTTSGTGSEVTPIAVLTITERNAKAGIMGPSCRATLAIIDPTLTKGMPGSITADTGMDAFSHAAEAMTSIQANPMSDLLADKAIRLICEYLPKAVRNGADMEARTQMSFAAMLAGYAFADSITHFGHAIGHSLGAKYHIPHGNACGIALPGVMEFVCTEVPERVANVGKAMGLDIPANTPADEIGKKVGAAIKALSAEIGLKTLADHKIDETTLAEVAEMSLRDGTANFSPKKATADDIMGILTSA